MGRSQARPGRSSSAPRGATPGWLARIASIRQTQAVATTVRCPQCQRRNQIPAGAAAKARCGVCGAPLMPNRGRGLDVTDPSGGPPASGAAQAGSPWGPGGPPGPASPWGPGGPGGAGASWGGGGDPTGARMRQTRRGPRRPSTGEPGSGPSRFGGSDRPGDPRAALVQRWDELLRLAPPDMSLTAAMGESAGLPASDPISWLSVAADVPRATLDEVRHIRNSVASNRPVPDHAIANALETLDRVLAVVGRMRLPE